MVEITIALKKTNAYLEIEKPSLASAMKFVQAALRKDFRSNRIRSVRMFDHETSTWHDVLQIGGIWYHSDPNARELRLLPVFGRK